VSEVESNLTTTWAPKGVIAELVSRSEGACRRGDVRRIKKSDPKSQDDGNCGEQKGPIGPFAATSCQAGGSANQRGAGGTAWVDEKLHKGDYRETTDYEVQSRDVIKDKKMENKTGSYNITSSI
jgi:hypothetical protein